MFLTLNPVISSFFKRSEDQAPFIVDLRLLTDADRLCCACMLPRFVEKRCETDTEKNSGHGEILRE